MNSIRAVIFASALCAAVFAAPHARATNHATYVFTTNGAIKTDNGCFVAGANGNGSVFSGATEYGSMRLEWTDEGSFSLDTNGADTYFGMDPTCTAANNGSECALFYVPAGYPYTVTNDGLYWHFHFPVSKNGGTDTTIYTMDFVIGPAKYLGAGGASLGGMIRSDSYNTLWIGASGQLTCTGTGCRL